MKKAAIILAFLFLLSLSSACGSENVHSDVGSGENISAAVPEEVAPADVEPADTVEEPVSDTADDSSPEDNDAGDAEDAAFSWNGYSMTFSFMTADLAGYGLEDFQGSMVLVRLAAVDGTIAYNDFHQNLFELVGPDGNAHTCKFFVVANTTSNPVIQDMPADQQDYIDMLFEMSDATAEDLAEAHMNVYEEEGGQPVEVPLKSVPQETEE